MALAITHTFVSLIADDPAALAAGEVLPSYWNASHTLTGKIVLSQLDESITPTWTGLHTWALGTITTSQPYTVTQTWNAGAVTFTGEVRNYTSTASAVLSKFVDYQLAGASTAGFVKDGSGYGALGFYASAAASFNGSNYFGMAFASSKIDFYAPAFSSTTPAARIGNPLSGTTTPLQVASALGLGANAATSDVFLFRSAAAVLQLGHVNAASPVAQTLQAQGSRSGTDTNVGGANLTVTSGNGTGTGTISTLIFQSPVAVGSGTGAQTQTTGLTIKVGTAVLTSYIVANLPAAATAGAGALAFVTDATLTSVTGLGLAVTGGGANKVIVVSDGTNWIII